MTSRLIALGTLGLACVVAAGGGAYFAVRQNTQPPAQAAVQPETSEQVPTAPPLANGIVTTPSAPVQIGPPPSDAAAQGIVIETRDGTAGTKEPARPARRRQPARQQDRIPAATADDAAAELGASPEGSATKPGAATPADPLTTGAAQPQTITQPPAGTQREYIEVTVPAESVLGLQVQTAVSSETAHVEDRVEARVTRDVRAGDRVAIPEGSRVIGSVVQVDRGGKVKERAQFAIRFHTLLLPDGTRSAMTAEALHREGPSPAGKSAAKIGGAAVGGAILGAILGGGKGAAIGGSIGAAGGTAATMTSDRQPATLPAGSIVNIRLMAPLTVTVER